MPPAPAGPGQDVLGGLLHGQDQPPQEPSNLRHAQREARQRLALNAVRGLTSGGGGRLFFSCSTAMAPARKMVNRANAHIASVICRYQPVQLRTSSWSRPTSPLASSKPLSTVQRLPATRTTSSSVVA